MPTQQQETRVWAVAVLAVVLVFLLGVIGFIAERRGAMSLLTTALLASALALQLGVFIGRRQRR